MAQVYLRSGGKLQQFRDDAEGVAKAFAALPADRSATLAALKSGNDSLLLRRSADGRFRITVVDRSSAQPFGRRHSVRRDHDMETARRVLSSFLAGTPEWRTAIEWTRGPFDLPVMVLLPATLATCVAGLMLFLAATGQLEGWDWKYLPNLVVGVVLVAGFAMYAEWFFGSMRQRLADRLGAVLGLRIVESESYGFFSRPGMWESADGSIVSDLKVGVLDFLVIILGFVIPITAFAVALIFAALPVMA